MAAAQRGEGTVGKLLTDETLYSNVNQLSSESVKLLYDFRQNPKKYLTIKFQLLGPVYRRGNVLLTGMSQNVVGELMSLKSSQRSLAAFGCAVKLVGFSSVVNRHNIAGTQLARDGCQPVFDREVNFGGLAFGKLDAHEFEILGKPRVCKRADSPYKLPGLVQCNIQLAKLSATHRNAVHRERVQQFVGKNHTRINHPINRCDIIEARNSIRSANLANLTSAAADEPELASSMT